MELIECFSDDDDDVTDEYIEDVPTEPTTGVAHHEEEVGMGFTTHDQGTDEHNYEDEVPSNVRTCMYM